MLRSLRTLDPAITLARVQEFVALYPEEEVTRAMHATLRARPDSVEAYFRAQFKTLVPSQRPAPAPATPIVSLRRDDPYAI